MDESWSRTAFSTHAEKLKPDWNAAFLAISMTSVVMVIGGRDLVAPVAGRPGRFVVAAVLRIIDVGIKKVNYTHPQEINTH